MKNSDSKKWPEENIQHFKYFVIKCHKRSVILVSDFVTPFVSVFSPSLLKVVIATICVMNSREILEQVNHENLHLSFVRPNFWE